MVTTDVFEKLKNLQAILVQIYDLEAKIADAPKQMKIHEDLHTRLSKEFVAKNSEYEAVRGKVLSLHFDLEEAIKSRESGEKGMDNITTHREYEALDKQITEASAKEAEIRKELQKEEPKMSSVSLGSCAVKELIK